MKTYTINQIAKIANISTRTLHHYDQIGLLKPAFVEDNGYRYYQHKQLTRLMQILFYKELDFSLEEIKRLINDPDFDLTQAFQDHRHLLQLKMKRLQRLVKTLDQILASQGKISMSTQTYKSFQQEDIDKYKDEVKARWGHTDAYRQSMERYKSWTQKDIERIKKEGEEITLKIANVSDKDPKQPEVQDLIKLHHNHINIFYDCTLDIYRSLGEMYFADPRFANYYNSVKPGLADFMNKAIAFYCDTGVNK